MPLIVIGLPSRWGSPSQLLLMLLLSPSLPFSSLASFPPFDSSFLLFFLFLHFLVSISSSLRLFFITSSRLFRPLLASLLILLSSSSRAFLRRSLLC